MGTRQQHRQRLIVGLAALLLALLAGITLVTLEDFEQSGSSMDIAQTRSIRIERPGRQSITLERQADQRWLITTPCELEANTGRIEPLLGALTDFSALYARAELDSSVTGLEPPEAVLNFDTEAFRIGSKDVAGERRYVEHDDRIGFAPEWLLSLVDGGLSAIARLEVFTRPIAAVTVKDAEDSMDKDDWQALTARQIVTWPRDDAPETTTRWRLSVSYSGGESEDWLLHTTRRYHALFRDGSACAYILDHTDLPIA